MTSTRTAILFHQIHLPQMFISSLQSPSLHLSPEWSHYSQPPLLRIFPPLSPSPLHFVLSIRISFHSTIVPVASIPISPYQLLPLPFSTNQVLGRITTWLWPMGNRMSFLNVWWLNQTHRNLTFSDNKDSFLCHFIFTAGRIHGGMDEVREWVRFVSKLKPRKREEVKTMSIV